MPRTHRTSWLAAMFVLFVSAACSTSPLPAFTAGPTHTPPPTMAPNDIAAPPPPLPSPLLELTPMPPPTLALAGSPEPTPGRARARAEGMPMSQATVESYYDVPERYPAHGFPRLKPTLTAPLKVLNIVATPPAHCPAPQSIPRPVTRADSILLPILMYHHVLNLPTNASPLQRGLAVTPEAFEQQAAFLAAHNYHTIYFADLVAYFRDGTPLPANPIILTFDDGWREHYAVVYPILRKYCLVGAFFPPINWVENNATTLTWAQIQEMSAGGMEFGSHTVNHHLLNFQTEEQIKRQYADSRALLQARTRQAVVALAYPGNSYNALAISLLPQAGYSAAVTTNGGVYQSVDQIYTLRRVGIRYGDTLDAFAAKLR